MSKIDEFKIMCRVIENAREWIEKDAFRLLDAEDRWAVFELKVALHQPQDAPSWMPGVLTSAMQELLRRRCRELLRDTLALMNAKAAMLLAEAQAEAREILEFRWEGPK